MCKYVCECTPTHTLIRTHQVFTGQKGDLLPSKKRVALSTHAHSHPNTHAQPTPHTHTHTHPWVHRSERRLITVQERHRADYRPVELTATVMHTHTHTHTHIHTHVQAHAHAHTHPYPLLIDPYIPNHIYTLTSTLTSCA